MVQVSFYGQMDLHTQASFKIIIFTEKVFTHGQMVENMMEIGKIIKWMGVDHLCGQMEENIQDNI